MKCSPPLKRLTKLTTLVFITFVASIFLNVIVRSRVKGRPSSTEEKRLQAIAASCGPLCIPEMNVMGLDPQFKQAYRRAPMSQRRCRALYSNPYMFSPLKSHFPPRHISEELLDNFTMNGRIPILENYFNNVFLGNKQYTLDWNPSLINEYLRQLKKGQLVGSYGTKHTNEVYRLLRRIGMRGKRVLVVGSQRPWCETAALAAGAKETVTLEFGRILASHPKMKAFTPDEFSSAYLSGNMPLFDVIISYSTYEHSGLGRYGDASNPWGDLIAVAMAWCVTKNDGLLVLEVPRARKDLLAHNMHRYYGPIRLPHLTSNWVRVFADDRNEWESVLHPIGDLPRPMVFKRMAWTNDLWNFFTTDVWSY